MSKKFSVQIPEPCSEDWEQMTPHEKGRFCEACQTSVIDFSKMSQSEIIAFFKNPPKKVCGRFQTHQLTTYHTEKPESNFLTKIVALLFGFQVVSISPILAQKPIETQQNQEKKQENFEIPTNLVFKGQVLVNEDSSALRGVNIHIKDKNIGTQTDYDGNFSLELKSDYFVNNKLTIVLSFVGMISKEIILEKNSIDTSYKIFLEEDHNRLSGELVVTYIEYYDNLWDRFRNWWRNQSYTRKNP